MTVGLVSCPAEKTNFHLVHSCAGAAAWPRHCFVLHNEKKQKQNRFFQWRISLWHHHPGVGSPSVGWLGEGANRSVKGGSRSTLPTFAKQLEFCRATGNLQLFEWLQWNKEIFVLGVFQAWIEDTVPALKNLYLGIKFSFHTIAGHKELWPFAVCPTCLCVRSWWKCRMGQCWGHLPALGRSQGKAELTHPSLHGLEGVLRRWRLNVYCLLELWVAAIGQDIPLEENGARSAVCYCQIRLLVKPGAIS